MYYQPERNVRVERLITDIGVEHGPSLRSVEYRHMDNPLGGCCYVLSEALYHIEPSRYKPMFVRVNGVSHWYLIEISSGAIVDLTYSQFDDTVIPYENGKGKGFLTKSPSKRAQYIIDTYHRMLD